MTENVFFKVPHFFSDIKSLTRLTILKKNPYRKKNAEKNIDMVKIMYYGKKM